MKYRITLYITLVFLCLQTLECISREAVATTQSGIKDSRVFYTQTSFYTNVETEGRNCADRKYHDLAKELVCASWDFRLGQRIRVSCNNRTVILSVCDRGPARRLYNKGRRLDVSLKAAEVLGFVKEGLATVKVEGVR